MDFCAEESACVSVWCQTHGMCCAKINASALSGASTLAWNISLRFFCLRIMMLLSFHPLSILLITEGWSLSQLTLGESWGTSWTNHHQITEPQRDRPPFTLTLKPKGNMESPVNPMSRFLNCGWELMYATGEHAISTHQDPHWHRIVPAPSYCEARALPGMPLSHPWVFPF